jgi:hypothetical protein
MKTEAIVLFSIFPNAAAILASFLPCSSMGATFDRLAMARSDSFHDGATTSTMAAP